MPINLSDLAVFVKSGENPKTIISVSKKVAAKAVDRNRIKRLIKESLRSLGFKGSIIVNVRNNLAGLNQKEVQLVLERLLKNV